MGIAFKNGSVHECTRVTFVGVAAYILLICIGNEGSCQFPLLSGRETCTTTSAKSGCQDGVDNLLRSHLGKNFTKCLITVNSDIFINVFRIDYTTVTKSDTLLFLVETGLCQRNNISFLNGLIIKKTGNNSTF